MQERFPLPPRCQPRGKVSYHDTAWDISRLHASINSSYVPVSHFTYQPLAHFTMPPKPHLLSVEVDPQLAEIEEWRRRR
jgi:hypothetical protein